MSIRSVVRPVRRVFPALLMGVVIAACSDSSPMGPDGRSIETVLTEDVTGLSLAPVQGLAGDPIDFLGLGVISVPGPPGPPLPTNVTVDWDFGDGAVTSSMVEVLMGVPAEFGATHTYASGGDYTVTLTVTDAMGMSETATASATVEAVEETDITYDELCGVVNDVVNNRGIQRALCAKLRVAERFEIWAERTGDPARSARLLRVRDSLLRAFIHQVNALAGKKLSAEDAAVLVAHAETLMGG